MLLNALRASYLSSEPYKLDARASLVVNSTQERPVIDGSLAAKAWEHVKRRSENGCIILGSLHHAAPSVLAPFLESLPFSLPSTLYASLDALRPFLHCITPHNPSTPRHAALAISLRVNPSGLVSEVELSLPAGGIDITSGLLNVPLEPGFRAFDVFYYLLTEASTPAEREFLDLRPPSEYAMLSRSGSCQPPSYLATTEDAAVAEDFRDALKRVGIKGIIRRKVISTLAGLLKLGDSLETTDAQRLLDILQESGGLLGVEPQMLVELSASHRRDLICQIYESLVRWEISRANKAIALELVTAQDLHSMDGSRLDVKVEPDFDLDCQNMTIIDVADPVFGKALAMQSVCDQSVRINAEVIQDGVPVSPLEPSISKAVGRAMSDSPLYQEVMAVAAPWVDDYLFLALPIYSLVLPLYSFWNQDDFSWGNTRVVIGEKGDKQVIAVEAEGFDPAMIPLQRWSDHALVNNLTDRSHERNNIDSIYASESVASLLAKPWSSIQFGSQSVFEFRDDQARNRGNRQSTNTFTTMFSKQPTHDEVFIMGKEHGGNQKGQRWRGGEAARRSISDAIQNALNEVNLETFTKRQIRAIVEQRLGIELAGEYLAFFNLELDVQLQEM